MKIVLKSKRIKKTPLYLRQGSDWPAHCLISHSDESHGDLLHRHHRLAIWTLSFAALTAIGLKWDIIIHLNIQYLSIQ